MDGAGFEMSLNKIAGLGAVAALMTSVGFSALAEEITVDAYSAWDFSGQLIPSSETESRMVGTFRGVVFVEEEQGLRDGGNIACTSDIIISSSVGLMGGDGSCVISTAAGPRVYGTYDCEGMIGYGCKGVFNVNSGSHNLEGVVGRWVDRSQH